MEFYLFKEAKYFSKFLPFFKTGVIFYSGDVSEFAENILISSRDAIFACIEFECH